MKKLLILLATITGLVLLAKKFIYDDDDFEITK